MEVENPMVIPQCEYKTNWEQQNRILAELEDVKYQDKIFEEEN